MTATIHRTERAPRPVRTRTRAAVLAFALLGLVQLFVSAVVPFAEARAPSRLGAHIEQQSERRHYVHDEAYCSACIARHLTGTAPLPAPAPRAAVGFVAPPATARLVPPDTERRGPLAARAPPTPRQLG
jgi:hypothetical protein